MKKKIVIAAESLNGGNGGINRVARLTARVIGELAPTLGFETKQYCLNGAESEDFGISTVFCRGSRRSFVLNMQHEALRASHVIFDSAALARAHLVGRFTNIRSACWLHGIEVWRSEDMTPNVLRKRRAVGLMDSLFANSDTTRVRSGFARAQRCWLGTESDELPRAISKAGSPRVLILSTVSVDYKGHADLLQAWSKVVEQVPHAKLTIAGGGPGLERLRLAVSSHRDVDSIEVLGFVDECDLDQLYASSSVFAMPSRGEGFGLVYIEAMRHRLPVVASVHDAGAEVNLDGATGFNVNLNSADELSTCLVRLLKDRECAEHMGSNAQSRWQEHFSYSCFRARFLPLLEDFLEQ